MAVKIPFRRELSFEYGLSASIAPGIRRVIARNPSPFTFHGTGTYILGHGDVAVIDGAINGSASAVGGLAGALRQFQSGRLYQYALVMLLGIFALLTWRLWPFFSGLMR